MSMRIPMPDVLPAPQRCRKCGKPVYEVPSNGKLKTDIVNKDGYLHKWELDHNRRYICYPDVYWQTCVANRDKYPLRFDEEGNRIVPTVPTA